MSAPILAIPPIVVVSGLSIGAVSQISAARRFGARRNIACPTSAIVGIPIERRPDMIARTSPHDRPFHGPTVVRAAFVLAMLGWGMGLYGPAVWLDAVVARTGWPLPWVSSAVTVHFLAGACVIPHLPRLYRRFGLPRVTTAGACAAAAGAVGWATVSSPPGLFAAAIATGAGWVAMGAVAVNTIVAAWFVRTRPTALSRAYNGASVGGIVFSPLWAGAISVAGFPTTAACIGTVTVAVVAALSMTVFSRSPEQWGQRPDGAAQDRPTPGDGGPIAMPRPLASGPWRDARFATLAVGMALGLFAQIGLLAHLFGLLAPSIGRPLAGWAMALATGCAIAGRAAAARVIERGAGRRGVAAVGYLLQACGVLALAAVPDAGAVPILVGVALVGSGMGNATSLPPLIAQFEFASSDVPRVVATVIAFAQACYAFAPAVFGALLVAGGGPAPTIDDGAGPFLAAVVAIQLAAAGSLVAGRPRPADPRG